MNEFDKSLYKTRKTVLELSREFDVEYISESAITLKQCTSCGIWLHPYQLEKDMDNLDICKDCLEYYGP